MRGIKRTRQVTVVGQFESDYICWDWPVVVGNNSAGRHVTRTVSVSSGAGVGVGVGLYIHDLKTYNNRGVSLTGCGAFLPPVYVMRAMIAPGESCS